MPSYTFQFNPFAQQLDLVGMETGGATSPTVSLTSPASSVREHGNTVNNPVFSGTITAGSASIVSISYQERQLISGTRTARTVLHLDSSPNPAGGAFSYTSTGSYSTNNAEFRVVVVDAGSLSGTSNTKSIQFTWALFYGNSTSPTLTTSVDLVALS